MTAKKILKYVVLAVVLGNLALIAVVLLGVKSPPPEPMPNPNGYDDFVKAGQMLSDHSAGYNPNSVSDLAEFISKRKEALQLVRLGLSRGCRVPNDYTPDYPARIGHESIPLRQIGHCLFAEGKLAEMQNCTNDAARSYLDAVRFSVMIGKGGTIISKTLSIDWEGQLRQNLQVLVPNLSTHDCRQIAQSLESLNAAEDPVERNIKEEKAWIRTLGFKGQVESIMEYKFLRKFRNDFVNRYQTNRLQRIQLTITFAERAYELEKGKKPQNLKELVPEYLKSAPIDPTTGTNIAFIP